MDGFITTSGNLQIGLVNLANCDIFHLSTAGDESTPNANIKRSQYSVIFASVSIIAFTMTAYALNYSILIDPSSDKRYMLGYITNTSGGGIRYVYLHVSSTKMELSSSDGNSLNAIVNIACIP